MNLKCLHGADARQIAAVHEALGMAAKSLHHAAMDVRGGNHDSVLSKSSQGALLSIAERIRLSMYGLEESFVRAAGMDTPFANTDNPSAWLEWLDQREAAAKVTP
jgi:hypothetical protein